MTVAALLAALALAAVLTNEPGSFVGDFRFEFFWSPGRALARTSFLWDASRGLGRPRGEFSPVPLALLGLFRGFGAAPALTERLWHATLLLTAGLGAVCLLRWFRPSLGLEHLVAGLFVMFSPFPAVFLIPSGLFINYALAPWLLLCFIRGVSEEQPWRWAALFALLIFAGGAVDLPGLVYALALIIPTTLYVVLVERSSSPAGVVLWLARAGVLSILISAGAVVQVLAGSASLTARLVRTESADAVNATSSWAESWRGLGYWVSYASEGRLLVRPQAASYFTSVGIVLATFLAPIVALMGFARSRWRPRLLYAALMVTAIVLMVGTYPPRDPPPYGRLVFEAYQRVASLTALRNSYKAGAGLALGVGCLLGVAIVEALATRTTRGRALALVACVGLLISAFPFWTGNLYSSDNAMRGLPHYWRQATDFLNRQPGDSRVLVLPGTYNARYRWGSPGDDILDALLTRPHIVRTALPLSTPAAADVVDALDDEIVSGRYRPGTLGPVARRLGIGYVLIRNDLAWQHIRRVRPSALNVLRNDPDLERVASFGQPGENVVAEDDKSTLAGGERRLKPIEVFRVRSATGPERVQPLAPATLLAGNGQAWFQLASAGELNAAEPIRYTAQTNAADLVTALDAGSPIAISDTNRRVLTVATAFGSTDSHTLASGEQLKRTPDDLFGVPGSQTVARFGDATRIASASTGSAIGGLEPWFRPADAFDGDVGTAWLTGGLQDPIGRSVRVDFSRPQGLSAVDVTGAVLLGTGRAVTAASLHFSDGSEVRVDLRKGTAQVRFRARRSRWLEVRIDAVAGAGLRPVGFAEVSIPGLDLVEQLQLPDDLFRLARRHAALRARLARAPTRYLMERLVGAGPRPIETAMRRRFFSAGDRSFSIRGTLEIGPSTADETIDSLLGDEVGAYGSERYKGLLAYRGGMAVDGKAETGWQASGREGSSLTVRFPTRPVDTVDVTTTTAFDRSTVSALRVIAGANSTDVAIPPSDNCNSLNLAAGAVCRSHTEIRLPRTEADHIVIEVTGVQPRVGALGPAPIEINEVTIAPQGFAIPASHQPGCVEGVLAVDGTQVPVRVEASTEQILGGKPVPFVGCAPMALAAGWHRVDAGPFTLVDSVVLATGVRPDLHVRSVTPPRLLSSDPSRLRLRLARTSERLLLVGGQAYDPQWRATLDGRSLGPPVAVDTQVGWVLPRGARVVSVTYGPQRVYRVAMTLSFATAALCLIVAVRGSSRPRRARTGEFD